MKKRRKPSQEHPPERPLQSNQSSAIRLLAVFGLLVGLSIAAYSPALQGGFIWDDDGHVTRPELQNWWGLYRIWFDLGATQQFYPLLHTGFWIQHKLWGDAPFGYHLVNVLLHATAAWLVYLILRRVSTVGALFGALIFALHPVHVESVAWITEQKNTLSAVFYLSAMLVYLKFDESRKASLFVFAFGLFILGLMCKTVTATLPAALLVIFWWRRGTLSWRNDILPLLPFFALGAAAGLFTAWVEHSLIGARGSEFQLSLLQRGLLAGRVPWFYLSKLLWPTDLIFIYPRWNIDPRIWWQWLFSFATFAAIVFLWTIRYRWRGPLAGCLLFVGTLFPVLGFLNVYPFRFSFVADHFQYLASLGVIAVFALGCASRIDRLSLNARAAARVGCGALLGLLFLFTWRQCQAYSNAITLYETTIARNSTAWMAYNNLGAEFIKRGQLSEGIARFQQALELDPKNAEVHKNLANAFLIAGQSEPATEHYRQAIAIAPDNAEAYFGLGMVHAGAERAADAVLQLKNAVRVDPDYADAHNALGLQLAAMGNLDEAISHLRQAIRINPEFATAHNNLGSQLASTGQFEEAVQCFLEAVRIKPHYPECYNNLGMAFERLDRHDQAADQFERALNSRPDYLEAAVNLTRAYAALNLADEALRSAETAANIARSQGRAELAEQIDAWRAGHESLLSPISSDAEKPKSSPSQP